MLVGELGEEVYHEQMAMIESFLEMCRDIDLKDCGKVSGKVKKDDLSRAIRTFLTDKSEEMLDRLVGALDREQPGAWVKYEKLFDEEWRPQLQDVSRRSRRLLGSDIGCPLRADPRAQMPLAPTFQLLLYHLQL